MWMRDETLLTFVHFLYRKCVLLRTYCVRSYHPGVTDEKRVPTLTKRPNNIAK